MFSYQTNRIINGICEYCGIKADACEHYKDGQGKPLDEKEKLTNPAYVPEFRNVYVTPLQESEKAASFEEAKAKMEANIETNPEVVVEAKPEVVAESEVKTEETS